MRTGFVHAIDAVLAGIILLTFLGTMFPPQEEVNWDAVHLRKEANSFIAAMDDAQVLDTIVLRDNKDALDAFIQSVSQNKEFVARVYNVPSSEINVAYLIGANNTVTRNMSRGDWNGGGLPQAEHHANGTIFGVPFVASDTQFDGRERYDTVNFDFNNDSLFNATGDPGEGPVDTGTAFICDAHFADIPACDGDPYQVGSITLSEGLVLFNSTDTKSLSERVTTARFDVFRSSFSLSPVNLNYTQLDTYDLAFVPPSFNALSHRQTLRAFAESGGILLRQTNDIGTFETGFLGFEDRNFPPQSVGEAQLERDGNYSGYYPHQFFSNMEMRIHDYIEEERFFDERNASEPQLLVGSDWNITNITGERFSTGTFPLAGSSWNVLMPASYNATYVSSDAVFTWDERILPGEQFMLDDRSFVATQAFPFTFQPLSGYTFRLPSLQASSQTPIALFEQKHYQDGSTAQAVLYTDTVNGTDGEAAVIGKGPDGLDYDNLLQAIMLFLTVEDRELGGSPLRETPIGDNSVGVNHFSVPQSNVTVPYGMQLIWWYA